MDTATIQKRIELLEKHEEELRTARDMIQGELENSAEYQEAVEEAKELLTKRKRIKEEILSSGPNQKLVSEVKENTEEIKTLREILSAELMQYYQKENVDEVIDSHGNPRKFKVVVKLAPKRFF